MSKEDRIDLSTLLHKLRGQMWTRVTEIKEKYPLVADYLETELKEMIRRYDEIHEKSPVTSEDEAMLFFTYRKLDKDLSRIEHEGFPYLWDEKLYKLLKHASENDLGISNNWVKVLIASNLLELSINQALKNSDSELFERLRRQNANIVTKSEEVNKILEKNSNEKLKRSDINFIKSHRIDADHPVSDFIKELTPRDVSELLQKVAETFDRLQPLLQCKSDPHFEAEIIDKGPFNRGDMFRTKVRFKGKLVGGFFDNRINAPKGTSFPGGSIWWCADPTNAPGPMSEPGKLVGEGEWESTWSCKIERDYPVGKYTVNICVYDHLGKGNRPVIKEKTVMIDVV